VRYLKLFGSIIKTFEQVLKDSIIFLLIYALILIAFA